MHQPIEDHDAAVTDTVVEVTPDPTPTPLALVPALPDDEPDDVDDAEEPAEEPVEEPTERGLAARAARIVTWDLTDTRALRLLDVLPEFAHPLSRDRVFIPAEALAAAGTPEYDAALAALGIDPTTPIAGYDDREPVDVVEADDEPVPVAS